MAHRDNVEDEDFIVLIKERRDKYGAIFEGSQCGSNFKNSGLSCFCGRGRLVDFRAAL